MREEQLSNIYSIKKKPDEKKNNTSNHQTDGRLFGHVDHKSFDENPVISNGSLIQPRIFFCVSYSCIWHLPVRATAVQQTSRCVFFVLFLNKKYTQLYTSKHTRLVDLSSHSVGVLSPLITGSLVFRFCCVHHIGHTKPKCVF